MVKKDLCFIFFFLEPTLKTAQYCVASVPKLCINCCENWVDKAMLMVFWGPRPLMGKKTAKLGLKNNKLLLSNFVIMCYNWEFSPDSTTVRAKINFDVWINGEQSKIGIILVIKKGKNWSYQKISLSKNVLLNWYSSDEKKRDPNEFWHRK